MTLTLTPMRVTPPAPLHAVRDLPCRPRAVLVQAPADERHSPDRLAQRFTHAVAGLVVSERRLGETVLGLNCVMAGGRKDVVPPGWARDASPELVSLLSLGALMPLVEVRA